MKTGLSIPLQWFHRLAGKEAKNSGAMASKRPRKSGEFADELK
jgi:hypothetical protein